MSAAGPAIHAMRKVCSWCGKLIQAGHGPTTHGICDECRDEHFGRRKPEPEKAVRS